MTHVKQEHKETSCKEIIELIQKMCNDLICAVEQGKISRDKAEARLELIEEVLK